MFEKFKVALGIAKMNKVDNEIEKTKVKLENVRREMFEAAKELLNTDVTKVDDSWIKEKYVEAGNVLELVKPYPSDMAFAELVSKYYDFVKNLEDEIKKRGLNIELGLAEKYKEEIFK